MTYQTAADHITSLRQNEDELKAKIQRIEAAIRNDQVACHYMNALIKVIKDNPGLLYGWQSFLDAVGIEEPSWKDEYENEHLL